MHTLKAYLCGRKKAEFADQIGTSPSYLSQILSGHRRPGFDLMVRIERHTDGAVPVSSWAAPSETDPNSQGAA